MLDEAGVIVSICLAGGDFVSPDKAKATIESRSAARHGDI